MTVSVNISRPLVDSFVHRKIKLLKTKGSGEAKFHIGSAENSGDFDSFFNNYRDENTYYFKKNNLLEFLLKEKFEFYGQFINQYKEVSPEYWDSVYEEVLSLPEEITFNLMSFNDGKRYYIRSESGDVFNDLVRRISLPLISILTIQKEAIDKFLFTLDVDFSITHHKNEEKNLEKNFNQIFESTVCKEFAYKVFQYLIEYDQLKNIEDLILKNEGRSQNTDYQYLSIKDKSFSLKSIFLLSKRILEEKELGKETGKLRYFYKPLFYKGENYYFNTEWSKTGNTDLDITDLKKLLDIYYPEFQIEEIENRFIFKSSEITQMSGTNTIIYGAPGAGKSASVSRRVGKNYVRTVFHPETQYSDFIGCLKPHKDSSGSITYSFRKGPFIQILEKALLNKEIHYFLVIEELNRANTAAVFGEIFQLLDRDDEGKSEYPILIQDEDLYDALTVTLGSSHEFIAKRQLMIPSNLSIIATMNSSDQAVFPLDTAFKRRWIFEYLPIDFTNCATGEVPIHHAVLPNVEWKTLAQTINTVLVQLKVVEDKLIGPWFIKDSDLVEGQAEQTFIGKICSYLWDDALKYKNKDEIFRSDIHGYGELYQRYSDQKPIFSDKFMEILQTKQDVDTEISNKTEAE
ncbi:AAA family ATPase [Acinetobacter sp.]|uniref:McrB family protein n=1 Tax=Acinetobacter sp. TaxID=472 RepID=UPI0028A8FB92|nr:AAA family ATPase [Acinetobacter sp.]